MKLKLTEEELTTVIHSVLEELYAIKDASLTRDVLHECLNNIIICEGLVKSYSVSDVRKVLSNIGIGKYGIKIGALPFFLYKGKEGKIPYTLGITFKEGAENIPSEFLEIMYSRIGACGWYLVKSMDGTLRKWDTERLKTKKECFTLLFEPKFDVLLSSEELPEKLYHVAPASKVEKILKKGIVPKSGEMFANHPERGI